jgi:arginyl-tRNA synthetase
MLKIKQELQEALAAALRELAPDASGARVFESPKVAAHGDFATTAAMQLAKPLKLNPRQVAERLRALLLAQPSYQTQWVSDIDIAGPGFLNIRLQAGGQAADRARGAAGRGARFGHQPPAASA